jgi:hypothetical protein
MKVAAAGLLSNLSRCSTAIKTVLATLSGIGLNSDLSTEVAIFRSRSMDLRRVELERLTSNHIVSRVGQFD